MRRSKGNFSAKGSPRGKVPRVGMSSPLLHSPRRWKLTTLQPTVLSHKSINSISRSSDMAISQEEVSKGTLCQSSVLEDSQECLRMGAQSGFRLTF